MKSIDYENRVHHRKSKYTVFVINYVSCEMQIKKAETNGSKSPVNRQRRNTQWHQYYDIEQNKCEIVPSSDQHQNNIIQMKSI